MLLYTASPKGETEEHTKDCLNRDTAWTAILYTQYSSVTRCSDNRMTEKYHGLLRGELAVKNHCFCCSVQTFLKGLSPVQARTSRQQRSPSPRREEGDPERQQLWSGRGKAPLPTKHPTRTGPSRFWTTPMWSNTRLNQTPMKCIEARLWRFEAF